MRKNYLMCTNFLLRSLLSITFLLTVAGCDGCKANKEDEDKKDENKKEEDKKEQKIPLKISLVAPNVKTLSSMHGNRKTLIVGDLTIEVTGGKDDAANYQIQIVSTGAFDDILYTHADGNAGEKALLEAPVDGTDLKTIFNEDVLEKGKITSIPIKFKTQLGYGCTSKSGSVKIAIVDKAGNIVGAPVEAKWTDAMF